MSEPVGSSTPVWFWLPGRSEPTHVADLQCDSGQTRWLYRSDFAESPDWLPPDPIQLGRAHRSKGALIRDADGLPGVLRDAAPAGYGADRLDAQFGRVLSPLERLEHSAADGVGALEACGHIERKLGWKPHSLLELEVLAKGLDAEAPSSRAIRLLDEGNTTSAGGERPKVTVWDGGRLWLAKMRDRNDLPWLPAKEFVAMSLARDLSTEGLADLRVPEIRYLTAGAHAIFLIERFDRVPISKGDAALASTFGRLPFASAHTVLRLQLAAVPGDPARSYVALADELRRWGRGSPLLATDIAELWRRMVTNVLLGNTDDHPRNHGLLYVDGQWRLSPLFDVTPIARDRPVMAMSISADGSRIPTLERLLSAAGHFGVEVEDAAQWLSAKAQFIAQNWAHRMRALGVPDTEISRSSPAFALAEEFASQPESVESATAAVLQSRSVRRRRPALF